MGGPGYRFDPWIKVRGLDDAVARDDEPVLDTDDDLTDRQRSILSALEKGAEIRVATVVERFGCSATIAKRDLAELRKRKLTRFDGPAKTGVMRRWEGTLARNVGRVERRGPVSPSAGHVAHGLA